jgi:two-component system CheB/CheR fusion protein
MAEETAPQAVPEDGLPASESASSRAAAPRGSRPAVPVVGLGASAGGLAALETFFAALPPDPGLAFVVVQHLDPHHKSILLELLQRQTPMRAV